MTAESLLADASEVTYRRCELCPLRSYESAGAISRRTDILIQLTRADAGLHPDWRRARGGPRPKENVA
jgi:hypothetical protein